MEIKELIEVIKQPAIEIMKENKIPTSAMIGLAIKCYSMEDEETRDSIILDCNDPYNPLYIDISDRKFDSIKDGIYELLKQNNLLNRKKFMKNKDVLSNILKNREDKDEMIKEIIQIIKANKLEDIDKEIQTEMFDNQNNVIEVNTEPFTDIFSVMIGDTNILTTHDKSEATQVAIKNDAYVLNSKDEIIYGIKKIVSKAKISKESNKNSLQLKNVNLYKSPFDTSPIRCITANVYLYNGTIVNGKLPIVMQEEFVGKDISNIIGYIKQSVIKK